MKQSSEMLFLPPYPDPTPHTLIEPRVLLLSLSLSQKRKKLKSKVNKQGEGREKERRKEISRKANTQSTSYVGQLLLWGACPGVQRTCPATLHWRQLTSLSQRLSMARALLVALPFVGISANTSTSRVLIQERQEGSLAQQDSVDSFRPNFWSLTLGSLF